MVCPCPGCQVGNCPHGECQTGQRPGGYCPAHPGEDFAEIVGAGYPAVHAAKGYLVFGLIVLTEVVQHLVGAAVDDEAGDEQYDTKKETVIAEPLITIAGEGKQVAPVEIGIAQIEYEPKEDDGERHLFVAILQAEGVDERPVYVMRLPEQKQDQGSEITLILSKEIKDGESQRRRRFHE